MIKLILVVSMGHTDINRDLQGWSFSGFALVRLIVLGRGVLIGITM